jgi:hypothetical protein
MHEGTCGTDGIASTLDLLPIFAAFRGAGLPEAEFDGLALGASLTKQAVDLREQTYVG